MSLTNIIRNSIDEAKVLEDALRSREPADLHLAGPAVFQKRFVREEIAKR